jgi:hypothetical protein
MPANPIKKPSACAQGVLNAHYRQKRKQLQRSLSS